MIDKWQAIHSIWSSFGIPAYDETDIPDDAVMPYITYSAAISSFEHPFPLTGSVWYYSRSWEAISKKVDEIASYLRGYRVIKIDGGYLYINQGTPFAQRMSDENATVRRIYVIIDAEFLTAD